MRSVRFWLLHLTRLACCGHLSHGQSAAVVLLLVVCAAGVAVCQDVSSAQVLFEPDSLLTISKRVDEVRLVFTVTDPHGKFVTALKESDFRVLDNGLPPERVYHFQAHTDLPLQIVLLVDISSSIRYRFPFEQKAASMLLKRVLRPDIDKASVIAFGTDVREVQSMTSDVRRLISAVDQLAPGGDTSLFDALVRASEKLRSTSSSNAARKVIILLTDGADTTSHATLKESINSTILSEATVLVVDATVPSENGTNGQAFLEELTTASGGAILPARHNADLKGAFQMIERVLRNQYALSYKPSKFQTDGSYRSVQLTAQKRHWVVRCRQGYFAK